MGHPFRHFDRRLPRQCAGKHVHRTIDEVASLAAVDSGGRGLAALYGDLADTILANVKDQREAAAEMVGILGFLASQGLSSLAGLGGAAYGGGVGGLAAKFAAEKLSEAAESLIRQADTNLKKIPENDIEALRAEFKTMVRHSLHDMMVTALWSDPGSGSYSRRRTSQSAGGVTAPINTNGPGGALLIPSPEDQPAHKLFFDWLERGGGRELHAKAGEALEESKILTHFESAVADHLFKRA